jgi:hypothetical protein
VFADDTAGLGDALTRGPDEQEGPSVPLNNAAAALHAGKP